MSGGGGGGGGGLFNDPLELALVAGSAIAAPYVAPALFGEGGALLGSTALGAGVTGAGIGALGGGLLGYNPVQTGLYGGLGGAAAGALGVGSAAGGGAGAGTGGAATGGFGLTGAGGAGATAPTVAGAGANLAPSIGFGTGAGTSTGIGSMYAGAAPSTFAPGVISPAASAAFGGGATTAATSIIPGISNTALGIGAGGLGLMALMKNDQSKYGTPSNSQVNWNGGSLANFKYDPASYNPDVVVPPNPKYQAQYTNYQIAPYQAAEGGVVPGYADGGLLQGGPVNIDFMGGGMYPQSQQQRSYYATPTQMPTSAQQTAASYEPKTNPLTGEMTANMAAGGTGEDALKDLLSSRDAMDQYESQYQSDPNSVKSAAQGGDYNAMLAMNQLRGTPNANYAGGGIANLGGYSDGGRMLKGPGDGMSDSIPATIQGKQPARLADNEFVVPADVVSHLGNGSSDAGAKKLYAMMDKVRKARTGKAKQAPQINANKYMPA